MTKPCIRILRRGRSPKTMIPYLQGSDGGALEAEIGLEVLSDLPDQPLEGQLADEKLGGLLVPPDLTEGHSSRPVTVRLLDSSR